jgi:hypothetical protein
VTEIVGNAWALGASWSPAAANAVAAALAPLGAVVRELPLSAPAVAALPRPGVPRPDVPMA